MIPSDSLYALLKKNKVFLIPDVGDVLDVTEYTNFNSKFMEIKYPVKASIKVIGIMYRSPLAQTSWPTQVKYAVPGDILHLQFHMEIE